MELRDRVAFVTGASGGLGRVIALTLARHGCDVALGYRSRSELADEVRSEIEEMGRQAISLSIDQTDPDSVQASVQRCLADLGRLDILVNNAAWMTAVPFKDLDALTPEIWDRIYDTNVRGPFLLARACASHLREHGAGRIVNVSAFIGLSPEGSSIAHATSKAALIHLNRCLAVALAPEITVNSVAPGLMEGTELFERIPSEATEAARERAALKRHTKLQDVADQVVGFCQSDSITGQVVVVDAGLVFH